MVLHQGHYTASLTRRVDPQTLVRGKYDWVVMRDGDNRTVAKGEADQFDDAWRDLNLFTSKLVQKDLEVETKLKQQHRLYREASEQKIAS